MRYRKKGPREKDLTERYLSGGMDEDRVDGKQRLTARSRNAEQEKILKTALQRAADETDAAGNSTLLTGKVVQVHSLYSDVEADDGVRYLCVVRKTLGRVSDTAIVVGDRVRFAVVKVEGAGSIPSGPGYVAPGSNPTSSDEAGASGATEVTPPQSVPAQSVPPQGVIEQVLERETILTRADSFKGIRQHPIVANAQQMLIVVSLRQPRVKWGLVDRMILAARSGKLEPLICLNKIDMAQGSTDEALTEADEVLAYYTDRLGIAVYRTSVETKLGLEEIRAALHGRDTVLAGHSGVGKSSLIRAIEPRLDLRVAAVSAATEKGRHTTTSARIYALDPASAAGGNVIDTPGVKLFGLWNVTRENITDFFPDAESEDLPEWRRESFQRIFRSLPETDAYA